MKGLLESVGLSPEIIAKYCKTAVVKRGELKIGSYEENRKEYQKRYRNLPGNREKANKISRDWYLDNMTGKRTKRKQRMMQSMCMRRLRAERKGSKEVFPNRIRKIIK